MNKPRLGYLGMGLMGLPMTLRLLKAGYPVTVWNRSPHKCDEAVTQGAQAVNSPAELMACCDIILMCLTDATAVQAVVFGDQGLTSAASDGACQKILVDFSSIHPEHCKSMAKQLQLDCGMPWLDAPVSGGTPAAKSGELTIMVGGEQAAFEAVQSILGELGSNVQRMGPSGTGQTTKLVNQIISGCTMTLVAEAVHFAEQAGVDATKLASALAGGFADSRPFQLFAPRMSTRQFDDPLGAVATMLKDLDTVIDVGQAHQATLPITETARQLMQRTADAGHADDDISTLILTYQNNE